MGRLRTSLGLVYLRFRPSVTLPTIWKSPRSDLLPIIVRVANFKNYPKDCELFIPFCDDIQPSNILRL